MSCTMLKRTTISLAIGSLAAALSSCGGGSGGSDSPPATMTGLACDLASIRTEFKPDASTTVVSVKTVAKGEKITAVDSGTPITMANDVCLVKLLVGPGNTSEPVTAPSYSAGIGMEIWLPAKSVWNERIRNYGGGGWVGGGHRHADKIGSKVPALVNANMGYAGSTHDAGQPLYQDGSFILKADGTINQALNQDFWVRAMYEQAVKTKALVKAYYGKEPKYAYYDGHSQGGRQGMKVAQNYPELYDGYMIAAPAINIPRMSVTNIYPQLVMKTDLGFDASTPTSPGKSKTPAALFADKLSAVNKLAVKSCDMEGLGFLIDPFKCDYNPAKKAEALCSGVAGDGVIGNNTNVDVCINLAEANAINKIWYGATTDGSYDPNQTIDSRMGKSLGAQQLWWNLPIGSLFGGITSPSGTEFLALVNQDAAYASSMAGSYTSAAKSFVNASTSVRDKWKSMSYATMIDSLNKGLSLESFLGNPGTDKADLSRLRDLRRKIILHGGMADNAIAAAGWINYYTRVTKEMGGDSEVQKFFRFYLVPAMAHSSTGAATSNAAPYAPYPNNKTVPLPLLPGAANQTPNEDQDQMFTSLKNWVEKGVVPEDIVIASSDKPSAIPSVFIRKRLRGRGLDTTPNWRLVIPASSEINFIGKRT